MDIVGIIIMVTGFCLMISARGIYRNGLKNAKRLTDSKEEHESYMMLVGNGMAALRIIGFILMLMGIPIFLYGIL